MDTLVCGHCLVGACLVRRTVWIFICDTMPNMCNCAAVGVKSVDF